MLDLARDLHVSRETEQCLRDYEKQLLTWSRKINLISKSTYTEIWSRHILDSAQLLRFAPPHPCSWLDLGSGGGLPGIVIAVLAQDLRPDITMELVESDSRKAAFLKLMVARYRLSVTITQDRVEQLAPRNADVISARAFAPLETLVAAASRLLAQKGLAIFPKGRNHTMEISAARAQWAFNCRTEPSILDAESTILLISDIKADKGSV